MTNPNLDIILKELKEKLSAHYGEQLSRLVLYGSQARGDAEPDSDIDVLVVLKGEVNRSKEDAETLELVADICLKHSVVIQWLFVSENRYRNASDSLIWNVRDHGMSL